MAIARTKSRTAMPKPAFGRWIALIAAPAGAWAAGVVAGAPRWIVMWSVAVAIYGSFKVLTYLDASERRRASLGRQLGYLFAWCGMNARTFLSPLSPCVREAFLPTRGEWIWGAAKVALGAALVFLAAPRVADFSPFAGGWVALAGIAFVLHFGAFHLLALAWRRSGVDAPAIMNAPHRAGSVAEFWGKRWNTAFRDLAHEYVLRPLVPKCGAAWAGFAAFAFSGLIHEVVITPAAGGGYGLPTLYFLLQGAGLALERSPAGRRFGLGRGWRGRLFAAAVVVLPAWMVFPPAFVNNVLWPMLFALGVSP